MKKRDVFDDLLAGFEDLEAQRTGKKTLRTTCLPSSELPPYTAEQLVALRKRLGLSQPIFAQMLRVKPATLKNWEQGKSTPNNEAQVLLRLVEQDPARILGDLAALG